MNWLERARREIRENVQRHTADSAKRNPTAAMAVPAPAFCEKLQGSNGSNGSAPLLSLLEIETAREEFEERAAIMEFDGGLSRDDAEREAWALVSKRYRLH